VQKICDDLEAEHAALDAIVAAIDAAAWDTPTPAPGWAVRDQIGHLAFYDEKAVQAVTEPDAFRAGVAAIFEDPDGYMASAEEKGRTLPPDELLAWWRAGRVQLVDVLRGLDPKARVAWYGPDMGARSFATARLMETWAHGLDVVDALGASRPATDRIEHICHLGVRTRGFSYAIREREAPEGDVFVELTAPSGATWTWGDPASADRVSGPAEDFCMVVAQRRHVDDTSLRVEGPLAREWMEIAQIFAGLPTLGPPPGGR
jgi:uncharacterized protein (TIGR03084 family)